MKLLTSIILSSVILILFACCNRGQGDVYKLVQERDSLRAVSESQYEELSQIQNVVSTLAEAIDSVQYEERTFVVGITESGDRQLAIANLNKFESVVKSQQKRISDLENKLSQQQHDSKQKPVSEDKISTQANSLISSLKAQLEQKNAIIEELRAELQKKDLDINRMKLVIARHENQISEMSTVNQKMANALKRSSDISNTAYVAVASKKELEKMGIIFKGKLQTKTAMDLSRFRKVDIRNFTDIEIEAKKIKFLTAMPENSYSLTTNGKNRFKLHITNTTLFWSVSNILVIETK